jgi:hypothetical protein
MSLLKLFRKVGNMARPKGVKNKTADAPVEFNYEDSDALYQNVMTSGAVAPVRDEVDLAMVTHAAQLQVNVPATTAPNVAKVVSPSLIYLVEGKVRLDQDGSTPIVADQRRIVNAANVDEALSKFVNYFTSMSNPVQRYTVVQAAASETIL